MAIEPGDRRRAAAALAGMAIAVQASPAPADALALQDDQLRAIEMRLAESNHELEALRQRLAEQERQVEAAREALERYRRSDEAIGSLAARGVAAPLAAVDAPAQASTTPGPVGEAPASPERPQATAQIFAEPTALTPQGQLVAELSYQFIHATDNRIALIGYTVIPAITIGLIDVQRVSRDINTLAIAGRYGVTSRFELEAKVNWVDARSSALTRPLATPSVTDEFFDTDGSGLGDAEVTARYQVNRFRGDNAVWIAYLRYKPATGEGVFEVPIDPDTGLQLELPTGSGFEAIQPGVTFLFPSDPAVFFGGVAYLYNFGRDVGNGYGVVDPGSVIDINLGMGLALNEVATFSIGYQHSVVGVTEQRVTDDVTNVLAETGRLQLGTMRFGVAYLLGPNLSMNLSLGIGVTDDSPDFEATLRLPYRF
jgi:hypothetical protein